MPITACTINEYTIYTGATETIHPVFTDGEGNESIQCNAVKLGGNSLNS